MNTGRRFTPARLLRWLKQGRGTGTGAAYQAWHQITRDDPGSRGRSHLISGHSGRLHHLLSDNELLAFTFASMLRDLEDVREQFPLSLADHYPEISAYRANEACKLLPGTLDLASEFGIKHPIVRSKGEQHPWVLTTDLLLTLREGGGGRRLLAISIKDSSADLTERQRELLRIEFAYWQRQQVQWLLITRDQFSPATETLLRKGMPWLFGKPLVPTDQLQACGEIAPDFHGANLAEALSLITTKLGVAFEDAQTIFWQAILRGYLPIDSSWSVRPSALLEVISAEAFRALNPIASGRSAW